MSKLTKADKIAWKIATRDVKKAAHARDIDDYNLDDFASSPCYAHEFMETPPPKTKPVKAKRPRRLVEGEHNYLDKSRFDKLKKGRMKAEAKLDLHGFRLDDAKLLTLEFITLAHAAGMRSLLIVTGKSGQIKQEFASWVNLPEISPLVLTFTTATPKEGGSGAYYIMLKKN